MTKVINLSKVRKYSPNFPKKKNVQTKKLSSYKKSDVNKLLLTFLALFSIFIGCLLYKNNQTDEVSEICIDIIKQLQCKEFFTIFLIYFKLDTILYISLFFLGTSLLGAPLTYVPIIIKCIFIGYLSSLMYNKYDVNGILFCLVLLYPLFAITNTSLIYAANESLYMSKYLLDLLKNKNTANNISVRLYLMRYSFLIVINLISILINTIITMLIANKFTLF